MSRVLIEDSFHDPEWAEPTTIPASDHDLLILTERLAQHLVPTKVFFQALAIAAYDGASAFRYADNYLMKIKRRKNRRKNVIFLKERWKNFDYN